MKAAYIDKPTSIVITDVDEPQITKENEVKIRVKVTGICGSEVHAYHGTHSYRIPPVVSGHEFAGEVVEVGTKVKKYKVGDRVTAEPQYGCGNCNFCLTGEYNLCKKKVVLGTNKWSGSFGEYVVVPEETVVLLSDKISFEQAALIEPLAVGMHTIRSSKLKAGKNVAIIGAGTIGLSILLNAKIAGAKNIMISDMVEYNLEIAKQLGATHCIHSAKENTIEKFMEYTVGKGADIVYIAADANPPFQIALKITSSKGTVAAVTTPRNAQGCDLIEIVEKELTVIGSYMYVRDEFEIVRDKIADGSIDVSPFISKVMPVEKAAKAMEIIDKKTENVIKVLLSF